MRGDHFSPDAQELIATLARHHVRFLLVGGEAVIYHGYPRLTGDVDLWYDQTPDNVAELFAALREFWGGAVPGVDAERELLEPNVVVQFGRPPHRVDLLGAIDGVTFEDAWSHRVDQALELTNGNRAPLPVIGLADLLTNKRASGRHKDLDDVEHLEPLVPHPDD